MSELAKRSVSAVVLIALALGALWVGGWLFAIVCIAVGAGVFFEWRGLVSRYAAGRRPFWLIGGLVYIGGAVASLIWTRETLGPAVTGVLLASVWAVDIGAYFAGRAIGGPKLAPRISPAKTWSGLFGGAVAAALIFMVYSLQLGEGAWALASAVVAGLAIAIIAQAGDLFESWMKRRAAVKDSGRLIPGHGGLFDRVDGLLAVAFAHGLVSIVSA